ncbi:TPA: phage tail protein [Streptococcus suis]|nr:hypothetical protein [Streptococcus suis]HEM4291399.1 phage tail protein [Streptococcus suis]
MISLKDKNVLLVNAFDDEIEQEGNGKYQLSFKYPTSDQRWKNIELADLLLADDLHGEQEFRVFEIVKRNGYIFVYANQVVDDLNSYSISNISVDRVNGQTVMQALAGSIIRKHPFAFYSDIQDRHVFNQKNISVMGALANGKHSIIGQWGGDLVRDKYNVNLLKRGGRESEALFMYKKNLKSYAETNSIKGLFTRLNLSVKNSDIKTTVDSPLIGSYGGRVYELNVEVADQDVATLEQLQEYGRNYFAEKLIDVPNNSLTISVTDSQEYDVRIFDTVFVHHEIFDKDLRMKITSYRFSPMGRKLKSIGFGKIKTSLTQQVSNIATEVVEQSVSVAGQVFEEKLQKEIENADKVIDGKINKVRDEINDGIEQSRAEAERHADNIKRSIDTEIAQVNQSMQAQSEEHDRQVADILSKAQSVESLANQAKADAASALARANQVKTEAIADARAQVATVSQALNTAKSELQTAIANADQKARDSQASATALRNDLNMQASKILEQARAQTALTNRVSTVETLADGTRSTVAELSKTVSKATGDITSVISRTKTVEDTLSQTRTQYEALTQTVNTQTGQIESINRKTADLQSGIDGVTERFESLRIEDNLLLNSSFNENLNQWQGTGVTIVDGKARITGELNKTKYIYQSIKSQIANDDVSQVYIASISVKVTNYVAGRNPFFALYIDGRKNDSTNTWFGGTYLTANRLDAVNNRGVVQFATTFRINVPRNQIKSIEFYIYARDFTGEVEFEKVSLRRGNIDLGWQASPEDLRSEIATYKRSAEESSAELSRQIQLADGKAVEAKTYAQQTAEGFKTRLESLETYKNAEGTRASQYFTASRDETARQVSALRVAVTQDYVAKSVFEETARGISQRFESLYVGGTNLLTGTDEYTEIFNSEQSHAEFLRTPYDLAPVFDKYGLIEYTLSFDLRASQAGQVAVYQQNGSGSKYSGLWKNLTVTTEWRRFHVTFTPTEGTMSLANSYLAFYGTYGTGVKPIIRRAKIERGAIATDWSPAPEDQQSYADTKIAEYKTTVDGRFATLQSQKANQVDLQTVRETANLYERIIGSTETGIKDKVARMVMADSLFLTEVKDKISGTATQVSQLNNSYAIKNLTSAGTVLNQINLLANGTNRIDGRLTHITGQTLIDNGVIKNAMIGELDAGKITSGTVDAARIKANSIDGSKIAFDEAFFNGLSANQAYLKKLFAKDAFLTAVQAVTLSASKIAGGVLEATNGAVRFDLNNANLAFNQNATINFNSDNNALVRKKGDVTAFINFADDPVSGGVYAGIGVTSHAVGVTTANNSDRGKFAGMRVYRPNDTLDLVRLIGDTITLAHGTEGRYFSFKPSQLRNNVDMLKLAGAVYTLSRIFMHLSANGWAFDHPNFIKGVKEEMARNWLQDFANKGLPR